MSGSWVKTKPSQRARSGFTLVEMLLVLGVFIVFAGITIPSVMRMFGQQKLTHAAERVRESVASARFRAIDTGLIYQFCCESGGSRFVVVPFEPDHPVTGGSGPAAPVTLQGRSWGQLPQGIVFSSVGLNSALPTSSTPTTSTPRAGFPRPSTWRRRSRPSTGKPGRGGSGSAGRPSRPHRPWTLNTMSARRPAGWCCSRAICGTAPSRSRRTSRA